MLFTLSAVTLTSFGTCSVGNSLVMAEDLEKLYANLIVRENESNRLVIPLTTNAAVQHSGSFCPLGKVLSTKPINVEAVINTLKGIWNPPHGISYTLIDDNIPLFRFFHPIDKAHVLQGCPLSFDQKLLVLTEYEGDVSPRKIPFSHCDFWIQVFNVPLDMMTIDTTKIIV